MTTDQIPTVWEEASELLASWIVPLYQDRKTRPDHVGTGFFVHTDSGTFLVSAGFDHKVNIFSADDWALVQSLSGHTAPVASVDVSRDGKWIVSGGNDRTIKLWGRNDGKGMYDA